MESVHVCPRCQHRYVGPRAACPRCLFEIAVRREKQPAEDPIVHTVQGASPPEPPALEEIVRAFGDFDGFELVGRGGMGVVYRARQKKLDRLVALKILPRGLGADPSFRERFLREARALARLTHPHIVAVHDYGENDGLCYLVLEYVDGTNLRAVLRDAPPSPRTALGIVRELCDALQYAHDEGVVHRDIKPENVLVDRAGKVKIADFGLAKLVGADPGTNLTAAGQVMGTPHYMAPEQIERPGDVDHRADLFALGVVLYEMLTGSLPRGAFELPSSRLQVDVRVDEVVLKALERDPARRYQHAIEVKSDVAGIEAGPLRRPGRPASGGTTTVTRPNALRGLRGVGLFTMTWIVTAVLWNVGPFALGVGVVLVLLVAGMLLHERVRARPELEVDLHEQRAGIRTLRRVLGLGLGLAAVAALFVGHVSLWEHGTSAWAPSFARAEDVHTSQVPTLRMEYQEYPGESAPPDAHRTTIFTTVGSSESPGMPWSIPAVTLLSLAFVLAVLAGYWATLGSHRTGRRQAWHAAGVVAGQAFAALFAVWAACWVVALRERSPLGDVTSSYSYAPQVEAVESIVKGNLERVGLALEFEQDVRTANAAGTELWRGRILRFSAPSPFARWDIGLGGARRRLPQVWCVLGTTPGTPGTRVDSFAGRYRTSGGQELAFEALGEMRRGLH